MSELKHCAFCGSPEGQNLVAELRLELELVTDLLERASRELTDTHRVVLEGRKWAGVRISAARAAISRATPDTLMGEDKS